MKEINGLKISVQSDMLHKVPYKSTEGQLIQMKTS